jgi:hypothetical protein
MGLIGVVGLYSTQVEALFGPKAPSYILVGAAVLGMILRSMTSEAITFKKQ